MTSVYKRNVLTQWFTRPQEEETHWNYVSNGQKDIQFWNLKLKGSVCVRVMEDSLKRISEVVYRVESLGVQRFRKKKFGTEKIRIFMTFTPKPHTIRVIKSSSIRRGGARDTYE
jgi:hypothetical protein